MTISEKAARILKEGQVKMRVRRSGMYQLITFRVKRIKAGTEEFPELFADRIIDTSEILRVANEIGLAVEAQNGRVFPESKGAKDFIGL